MAEIRKAVPGDALGIAIVNVYTWKTAYAGLMPDHVIDGRIAALREIAARLRSDIERNGNFIVAVDRGAVVGMCIYGDSRNENFSDAGEIFALYVLKGFQGTGLGKALFSAAATELLAKGKSSLLVNCLIGNPALDFYRHLGGKVVGRRTDVLEGWEMTEDIVYYETLDSFEKESDCGV